MRHWTELDVPKPAFTDPAADPNIEVKMSLATPMLGGGVDKERLRFVAVILAAVRGSATYAEVAAQSHFAIL
jgi:hypothetical protein